MGILHGTWNREHLFDGVDSDRNATVGGEESIVDQGSNWHQVKAVVDHLPHIHRQSGLAFAVEGELFLHISHFVVATQQYEILRCQYFEAEQEKDYFDSPISTVDKVPKKEIFAAGEEGSTSPEIAREEEQILEVSMQVAKDIARRFELLIKEDIL